MDKWKAQPFEPFNVWLADGRSYRVVHPDLLARSPSGRTITVYQPDETSAEIDLVLVTALESTKSNGRGARGRGGRGRKKKR
jgi:hypothetical protein